ncbi:MAG TPA: FadR/GntR family transcriptional regulator [Polyangiaceae bacterium]|nr:FadR/GntR family transcriptional regulator [Polyangiaceae bacterium]
MPIQAVEVQRLYRQIADHLSALIAAGEFAEGSRLPSERELAVQLGVSRPSVREALIALEVAGKVEVRVGSGIFVASRRPLAIPDPDKEGQGPFELLRARALVEGEVAAEAARTAKREELDVVRAAIAEMKAREHRRQDAELADRDFHLGIARATHNSALVSVVQDLWDRGRGDIWKRMEHHFQTPALRAATFRDHKAILAALEARDARAARAAMRQHLERVDREFSRGWELLKEQQGAGSPSPADAAPVRARTPRAR